ncbi:MAG: hypothetical protein WC843_02030 [Candidatus Gracilibacteria bacterium]
MEKRRIIFDIPNGVTPEDIDRIYFTFDSKIGFITDWVSNTLEANVAIDLIDAFKKQASKAGLKEK